MRGKNRKQVLRNNINRTNVHRQKEENWKNKSVVAYTKMNEIRPQIHGKLI